MKLLFASLALAVLAGSASAGLSLKVELTPTTDDARWTDKTTEWVPMTLTLTNTGTVAATAIEWDFVSTAPLYSRMNGYYPTLEFVMRAGESLSWDSGMWCRSSGYFPGYSDSANYWDLQALHVDVKAKNVKELSSPSETFRCNYLQRE